MQSHVLTICNMCFVTDANFIITSREPISHKNNASHILCDCFVILSVGWSDLAPCAPVSIVIVHVKMCLT